MTPKLLKYAGINAEKSFKMFHGITSITKQSSSLQINPNIAQGYFIYILSSLDVHRPECYDLLKHNCNSFSNEVVQFLTGQPIPDYIINLPNEALNR